jgi:hypothetical protein
MRKYKGGVNSYDKIMTRIKHNMVPQPDIQLRFEPIPPPLPPNLQVRNPIKRKTANRIQKEEKIIAARLLNQDGHLLYNQAYFNSLPPPPDWLLNRIIAEHHLGGKSKTRRNKTRKHRTKTK